MTLMPQKLFDLYDRQRKKIAALAQGAELTGDYLHPVFGEGPMHPRLMLIGEAPGRVEAEQGRPFVGKAGMQLDELLIGAGIERSEVFVTNVIKYRPTNVKAASVSNRTPVPQEIRRGAELIMHEIMLIRPEIIATLGNTPLRAIGLLSGNNLGKIGSEHGRVQSGCVEEIEFLLFPLYHPASGIYNRALLPVMKDDIAVLGILLDKVTSEEA
ncbi:MAG: uracil-DNA glycosylase [Clostridia bacterium]